MINIERIIKTGIPDIAPVYGGSEAERCRRGIRHTLGLLSRKRESKLS